MNEVNSMKEYISVLSMYAQFQGRTSKTEFLKFLTIHIVVFLVLRILDVYIADLNISLRYGILTELYFLGTIVPFAAVSVRRFRDTGRSGSQLLYIAVMFVLFLLFIQPLIDATYKLFGITDLDSIEIYGVFLAFIIFIALLVYYMSFMLLKSQPDANQHGDRPSE
jgi:uncharacterized membrane protein YhaH (DUF805 family)